MVSKEQKAKEDRIERGVKEILEFRGFIIKETNEKEEYMDVFGERRTEDDDLIKTVARIPKEQSIGVKNIRDLDKLRKEEDIQEALLIAEAPLTHYAKKESISLGIEIISSSNPLFNIFDHEIVPTHVKLTEEEVQTFLEKYKIEKYQIPKILDNDPAVRAIQAKPGDIIKIDRSPLLGDIGAYYRYVIKSSSRLRLADTLTKKATKVKKVPSKTTGKKKGSKEEEVEDDVDDDDIDDEEEEIDDEEVDFELDEDDEELLL